MKQNITPHNDNNLPHGYYEEYFSNGQIWYKGTYINGIITGYWKYYYDNGKLCCKGYYINGRQTGYWEWYDNRHNKSYQKEYIII
jgi:antitoxin component YwqK of YwqJK toxin-antitoxin module